MNLHLSLNPQQMDYIHRVLAQRPWGEVAQLMADIAQQIDAQQRGPMVAPQQPVMSNGQDIAATQEH